MDASDSTPVKKVSAPIRMEPALAAKVAEAVNMTGLAQADILRLALAIGLEDLRRVGYDLPLLISGAARPDLEATARRSALTVVPPAEERDELAKVIIVMHGTVAAGGKIAADVVEVEIPVAKQYPKGHYALRVLGHSMEPAIPDGAVIIVKEWKNQGYPKKGTTVVYNDGHDATLKVYDSVKSETPDDHGRFGKVPVLKSINPEYSAVEVIEGGRIDAVLVEVL